MFRSLLFFVLAAALTLAGSVVFAAPQRPEVEQPIAFNHLVHTKRVSCRECHFVCEKARDDEGEIDCEACEETELPFCDEHAACPDHKLPQIPNVADCLRCHVDDLVDLKEALADGETEIDASDAKKEVLLDYVEIDEDDEVAVKRRIEWKRVSNIRTSNIFFSHRLHAQAKRIACRVCHGDVAEMERPPTHPAAPIGMAWCLDCHEHEGATSDCMSCHR